MTAPYFEFYYIHMQNGGQTTRMAKWLETRLLPICQKHGFGTMGFFTVSVGRDLPTTLIVFSFPPCRDGDAVGQASAPTPIMPRRWWKWRRTSPRFTASSPPCSARRPFARRWRLPSRRAGPQAV